MKPLSIRPIQTEIFRAGRSLTDFVATSVPPGFVREDLVLAVTSKIVSLAENRLVDRAAVDKRTLVQKEADLFLGEIGHGCFLTIKNGLLIPSAGIDESNSESGNYILYPEDPFRSALALWRDLREIWGVKNLGVILTDSRTSPLRRGLTGICLSYAGFRAVRSLVGNADLFGRELRMTQMNYADGLAAGAVLTMGEGAEARPLALIENSGVEFSDITNADEVAIPLEEDLYGPLLKPRL